MLVVDVRQRFFQGCMIVGHGPTSESTKSEFDEWHAALMKWHRTELPVFLLADLNGRHYYLSDDPSWIPHGEHAIIRRN
eukprot:339564-Karenia_brevis.AAC.1